MKLCVVTVVTGRYCEIGAITLPAMKQWCDAFGMDLVVHDRLLDESRNASWNKVLAMQQALREYDVAIWLDIDTLVIQHWPPLSIFSDTRMSVSADFNGACLGVFSLPRSLWSISLLETMWFLGQLKQPEPYDTRDAWEQNTFKCLDKHFPAVSGMVLIMNPRTTIANPSTFGLNMAAPPLAYHAWANRGVDVVVDDLKRIERDKTAWLEERS